MMSEKHTQPYSKPAPCLSCGSKLNLGVLPHKGDFISCGSCGLDHVILSLSPLQLDWAFEEDKEDFPIYDPSIKSKIKPG